MQASAAPKQCAHWAGTIVLISVLLNNVLEWSNVNSVAALCSYTYVLITGIPAPGSDLSW